MRIFQMIIGILCFVVAALVFVYIEGARRYYSGILFMVLGVVTVVGARRRSRNTKRK